MKEKRQVSLLSLWNRKNLSNRVIAPKECTTTSCRTDGSTSHGTNNTHPTTNDEEQVNTEITPMVGLATNTTAEEQQENEHEPHPVSVTTVSSSTCCANKEIDPNYYQPSDYELLRLQNIARNEARLRELGLLTSTKSTKAMQSSNGVRNQNKKRRRQPSLPQTSIVTLPHTTTLRRSARLSQNTTTNTNQTTNCNTHRQLASSSSLKEDNKDHYKPFFHKTDAEPRNVSISSSSRNYSPSCSTNPNTAGPILWNGGGTIPTIQHVKTKLIPPNGLSAIYALQFSSSSCDNSLISPTSSYVVGAGKSGVIALWDIQHIPNSTTTTNLRDNTMTTDQHAIPSEYHPIVAWKAHSGRWISSTFFLPSTMASPSTHTSINAAASQSTTMSPHQQQLITAGNDGSICIWDVSTVTCSTGIPRLHYQSDQNLHSSGIFAMDVVVLGNRTQHSVPSSSSFVSICTGSKDKSIALSEMTPTHILSTTWRSHYHTSKVSAVRIQPSPKVIVIASASDDGIVALHDVRTTAVASTIPNAHSRPHSVEWMPSDESSPQQFITAGWDDTIHLFDLRNVSKPMISFRGHHPSSSSTYRMKRIHRPILCRFATRTNGSYDNFLVTGGEGTHSLFVYPCHIPSTTEPWVMNSSQVQQTIRQGILPQEYGDVGSITVQNNRMCLSMTTSGDILLLDQPPLYCSRE